MLLRTALALCFLGTAVQAQQQFTTQVMLVPAFTAPNRGLGGKAADIIRDRVADAFKRQELKVVSGGDMDDWLRRSGFEENVVLSEGELKELARQFRADERITGSVSRTGNKYHIDGALALIRDLHLAQPLAADGATIDEAATAIARDAIAARAQLVPLRNCENHARAGNQQAAATAAAVGLAAYPRAVPARVCFLNAITKLGAPPDSLINVAKAVLAVSKTNPLALQIMAESYDAKGASASAAPAWIALLATDSTSEDLTDRVVNALAREHNTAMAQPLIDRGTDSHPDNLPLLKLRWLIHLANNDWKGSIAAGEKLLQHDAASQVDPDLYARLAGAYRADSQPAKALSIAAAGVAKFPTSAPLYVTYLQMLHAESDAAIPRGLAAFPDNPEIHVIAAQTMKQAGNAAGALAETQSALAANPRLPHGYLQLAQLEIDLGQVDSAYVSVQKATKNGEDSSTAAQFALARGNAMYKAATGTQKREDFQRAFKFLSLAAQIKPSPEAKFLMGASALSISQSAATEAPTAKSCDLSKLADSSLTEAEINLVSGGSVAPDAAKTYLDYVAKLRPFVNEQVKAFCM